MTAKSPSRMEMERASFETYCRERHKATVRHTVTGEYLFRFVERDWQTWLAARERPDEVVVAGTVIRDTLTCFHFGTQAPDPSCGDAESGFAIECNSCGMARAFDAALSAVVVRKSEGE